MNHRIDVLGFKKYEPSLLPKGLSVKNEDTMVEDNGYHPAQPIKVFNINLNKGNITERAATAINDSCDYKNIAPDQCSYETSPAGQTFIIHTWYDKNPNYSINPAGQQVYFLKGQTAVLITLERAQYGSSNFYKATEWGGSVDSFH